MQDAHPTTINYMAKCSGSSLEEPYFATMCSSGALKLWVGNHNEQGQIEFSLKSELLFGRNLQEVVEIKKFGDHDLLLLTGGYDSKIHVYMTAYGRAASELKYQFSMAGHFNSVKTLSFSPTLDKNAFYLASGSQDNNVRIWKIQPMENLASEPATTDETKDATEETDEWMKQFETKTSFLLKNS